MKLTGTTIKQLIKEELRRFLLQEQEEGETVEIFDRGTTTCSQAGLKWCIEESGEDFTESRLNALSLSRLQGMLTAQNRILARAIKEEKKTIKKRKAKFEKLDKKMTLKQQVQGAATGGPTSKDWNAGSLKASIEKCPDYYGKSYDEVEDNRPGACVTRSSKVYKPIRKAIRALKKVIKERKEGKKQEPKTGRDLPYEDQKILQQQAMGTKPCDAGVYSTPEIGKFAYKMCMRSKGQKTEEDISSAVDAQRTLEAELDKFEKAGKKCSNSVPSAPRCPEGSQCVNGECRKSSGEALFSSSWSNCVQTCVDQGGDEERCKKACKDVAATGTEYEEKIHKANQTPNCGAGCPPGTRCTSFGAPRRQTQHCVKSIILNSSGAQAYRDKYHACLKKARPAGEVVLPTCDEGCPPGTICRNGQCVSLEGTQISSAAKKRCQRKAGYFSRKARKLAATGVGAGPPARGSAGGGGGGGGRGRGGRGRAAGGGGRGGSAYRRGLPILKKEGFKNYADFYAQLKAKGLMGELGPRGPDQKWGPFHRAALKALKGMATTAAPAGSPEFNQRLAPEKDISPHGTAGYPERGCGDSKGGYAPGVSQHGADSGTVSWAKCVKAGKDLTPSLRE